MFSQEITSSWSHVGWVVVSASAMLVAIIVLVRLAGLRSFSKMSAFDFTVTLAFGSLLASVSMSRSSLADGIVAAVVLLALQRLVALGRRRGSLGVIVDNAPLLLMLGEELLTDNLRRARVTESDIRAKLREANVLSLDDVRAVVFESTGDISVLHGSGTLDPALLEGVIGAERLAAS